MMCLYGPSIVRTAKCLVFVEARFEGNAHTGENYSDAILRLVETEGGAPVGPSSIPSLGDGVMLGTAWIDRPVDTQGLRSLLPRPPQRSMEARPCSSQ